MIRILRSSDIGTLLDRKAARFAEAEKTVRPILEAVRKRGDKALRSFALKYDNLDLKTVAVGEDELNAAAKALSPAFRMAVRTAGRNIRKYAQLQLPQGKSAVLAPGLRVGQLVR